MRAAVMQPSHNEVKAPIGSTFSAC